MDFFLQEKYCIHPKYKSHLKREFFIKLDLKRQIDDILKY